VGTQAKKPNALLAAVNRAVPKDVGIVEQTGVPEPQEHNEPKPSHAPRKSKTQRPSRIGTKLVAGHFDPKVARQLRIIAAEEDTTVQALLEEALDLLFIKKGKARIKDVKTPK
jgi:hypothetical protein